MRIPTRLYSNISRRRVRAFLEQHRTERLVVEIGTKEGAYSDLFPNTIGGDLAFNPLLDVQLDAHALPFRSGAIETLLCAEVLEHCRRPWEVVAEFERVLRPGGSLLLTTRFVYPVHDAPHDYFRFTGYGLRQLLAAFSSAEITPTDSAAEAAGLVVERVVRQSRSWLRVPLLLLSRSLVWMGRARMRHFGDVGRQVEVGHIATTGYTVHAVR